MVWSQNILLRIQELTSLFYSVPAQICDQSRQEEGESSPPQEDVEEASQLLNQEEMGEVSQSREEDLENAGEPEVGIII
jgi:hypothetical protein